MLDNTLCPCPPIFTQAFNEGGLTYVERYVNVTDKIILKYLKKQTKKK